MREAYWIVGRRCSGGTMGFATMPYQHASEELAIKEAERLATELSAEFVVFKAVSVSKRVTAVTKRFGEQDEELPF